MREAVLRPGHPDDAADLLALHVASIRGLGPSRYSAAQCDSWAHGLTAAGYVRAMKSGERFWVAEGAEGLEGFCSWKGPRIEGLFVHPGSARLGLGTGLLRRAEAAISESGAAQIDVEAALPAVPFYTARGYRTDASFVAPTRGGVGIEALRMAKSLGPTQAPLPPD